MYLQASPCLSPQSQSVCLATECSKSDARCSHLPLSIRPSMLSAERVQANTHQGFRRRGLTQSQDWLLRGHVTHSAAAAPQHALASGCSGWPEGAASRETNFGAQRARKIWGQLQLVCEAAVRQRHEEPGPRVRDVHTGSAGAGASPGVPQCPPASPQPLDDCHVLDRNRPGLEPAGLD